MKVPVLALLHGKKVELRPFTEEDITPDYIGWLNDPRVTRFSNQRFRLHDDASSRAYLATFAGSDNLFIGIVDREEGRLVGTMTVYINLHHKTADVGLLVGDSSVWGKGFGQDAWDTLGEWLLNEVEVRKLTAGTAAGNTAMVRIMERFGMQHEATRRGQELIDGRPHDLVYYAKFGG
jgi:[ribosomal protein S5]-alanine N-acetyltransferase